MFLVLAVLLAITYVTGMILMYTVPFFFHVLALLAIISFAGYLVRGRRV